MSGPSGLVGHAETRHLSRIWPMWSYPLAEVVGTKEIDALGGCQRLTKIVHSLSG